jgi:hypothetical protein
MLKIIAPSSYDFGQAPLTLVKRSSRGLIGDDRSSLLKFASAGIIHAVDRSQFRPGETAAILMALGATEIIGPNRNGDGFKIATCIGSHDTFVKFARVYRHHDNKPNSPSYGRVVASVYNAPMGRVELAVALNGTKQAAEANRGHLADYEINALDRGDSLAWSMACKIAHDVCSSCKNKARTRAQYCDGAMCKHGGLKHNIARTFEDGHTLHADNPNPFFFDISRVSRPADRIAYAFGALDKAASAVIKCGAELADDMGLTAPAGVGASPGLVDDMADRERESDGGDDSDIAFNSAIQPAISDMPEIGQDPIKLARVLSALASERVLLTPGDFLTLVLGDRAKAAAAAPALSASLAGVFGRLAAEGVGDNPYQATTHAPVPLKAWAQKQAAAHGLDRDRLALRARAASLRGITNTGHRKIATRTADGMAKHYAMYQLAFLDAVGCQPNVSVPDFARLIVRRNAIA